MDQGASSPGEGPRDAAPPGADRVLAVWCPDWPVLAVGADPDMPAAVLAGNGSRRTVLACSPAARAAGVRRGQAVRDAQRRCPELTLHSRDERAEELWFEPVVQAVEDVAAGVEVVRPGLIVLAARGPARYHGGEKLLAACVREAVADAGTPAGGPLGCGVAVADGAFAACLAARHPVDEPLIVPLGDASAFLAPHPLDVLDLPDLAELLGRLGLRTLGEFAALPAAAVANRFGVVGTQAHRLARGLDPRPPAARRPGEDLSAEHLFDPPAEQDEPIVFAAKALADRWHALMAAAGVTCAAVRIELVTESGRESVRSWRNGDALGAALSASALAQRVRWQLDGWRTRSARGESDESGRTGTGKDDADGRAVVDPVACLRLVPGPLQTDTGSQQTLWGREEVPDRVGRVAERVQAMLGHEGVALLHETGGRDPSSRIRRLPWGETPSIGPADDPAAPWPGALPAPAPALVPDEPYPAELLDPRGEQVGVTGRARLTAGPAVLVLGGDRLRVTGWAGPWPYHERPWSTAVRRRARLQLSVADGRAFLLALEHGAWRVEGVYQ
ncbi:DNA polymerase Y family protein [Actinospica robiniae]|uniref:DNA polymerase Y family protein n=1 Tax=Actinospica robiniae TaxID=304901 RepID=UPI00040B6057|nr:DNA polymerase Y family protein [Actinospica robiniae]